MVDDLEGVSALVPFASTQRKSVMRRIVGALAAALALVTFVAPAGAQTAGGEPLARALAWVQSQQQPDGGFPGFSAGETADAVVGLVAAGVDPNGVLREGNSPVSFLGNQAASYATRSTGAAAKLTLAVVAAGKDPRAFGGVDLPAEIGKGYSPATGQYGADVTGHCLALLAVRSVGAAAPPAAIARLGALQNADGGWSFDGQAASGSDTNTTSLCAQALVAHGADAQRALGYLKSQQNADGGFPYSKTSSFGSDTDANSTALVIEALAALGQDTATARQALVALQNSSGAFRYQASQPDDNVLATYQALLGLSNRPQPVASVSVPGAQEAIAPTTPAAPAALPNTGGAPEPALALALLALLGMVCGAVVRRRVTG
jgi:LPXTG-motif cell wall-anchored protein